MREREREGERKRERNIQRERKRTMVKRARGRLRVSQWSVAGKTELKSEPAGMGRAAARSAHLVGERGDVAVERAHAADQGVVRHLLGVLCTA